MLRDNRVRSVKAEAPDMAFLVRKLKEITDENLYLGRHLTTLIRSRRALHSMSSLDFQNDQMQTIKTGGILR